MVAISSSKSSYLNLADELVLVDGKRDDLLRLDLLEFL